MRFAFGVRIVGEHLPAHFAGAAGTQRLLRSNLSAALLHTPEPPASPRERERGEGKKRRREEKSKSKQSQPNATNDARIGHRCRRRRVSRSPAEQERLASRVGRDDSQVLDHAALVSNVAEQRDEPAAPEKGQALFHCRER